MQRDKLLKKGVKYFTYLVLLLLIVSIPVHLYLSNLRHIVFDEDVYKAEFEKYEVYEKFPGTDIDTINSDLLDYLRYEKRIIPIDTDFFNEKEKTHLMDVKLLMSMALFSLYIGFLFFALKFLLLALLVRYQKESLVNYGCFMLTVGGILTIIPALLLLAIMKINFSFVFNIFHSVAFTNKLWLMNPATDKLVVIYPEGLFYDIAIKIVLASLMQAVALIIIGISAYKIRKRFKNREGIPK